jgi:eukaryotic-like serine/threonine-protein kinase
LNTGSARQEEVVVAESQNPTLVSETRHPDDQDEDWSGRRVGEFQILRRLGRGGMGQVFLAEQTSLKRKVAVKMLRPELSANNNSLQRFKAEAEAVAKLNHANIVQIYAIGEQDGNHYMALEYVEGRNLRDYLNRKGPPDLPVCLSLMRQIANALQRAHEAGFIHRDVKPENILLNRKGEVKVTDFGLSRCFTDAGQQMNLTQSGVAMGTPLYMSPEQVQGKPADPRSDIYSYGVSCYHLLTGQPPFRGQSAFDVAVQHVQNEPPPLAELRPDLPTELVDMVKRMMAKKPEDRYASFKDILRDLGKVRESMAGAITALPPQLQVAGEISAALAMTESEFDAPVTPRRAGNKWLTPLVIGLVLVGMLIGGVTVRLVKNRLSARGSDSSSAKNDKFIPVVSSEEREALEWASKYSDPNSTTTELRRGLECQEDLLTFYLKKGRLDEAEQFVRELQDRKYKPTSFKVHPYQALGKLGQALILAFRDKSEEALKQLGTIIHFPSLQTRPAGGFLGTQFTIAEVPGNLFDHADLRRLLVDALDRIAKNLKVEKFEKYPQLDAIRKPPRQPSRPGIK